MATFTAMAELLRWTKWAGQTQCSDRGYAIVPALRSNSHQTMSNATTSAMRPPLAARASPLSPSLRTVAARLEPVAENHRLVGHRRAVVGGIGVTDRVRTHRVREQVDADRRIAEDG